MVVVTALLELENGNFLGSIRVDGLLFPRRIGALLDATIESWNPKQHDSRIEKDAIKQINIATNFIIVQVVNFMKNEWYCTNYQFPFTGYNSDREKSVVISSFFVRFYDG